MSADFCGGNVSRETKPDSESVDGRTCPRRGPTPYDHRVRRGAATREAIEGAVLRLIERGIYRPTLDEVVTASELKRPAILYHYGSIEILLQVVARDHHRCVYELLRQQRQDERSDAEVVAWALLVGRRQEAH